MLNGKTGRRAGAVGDDVDVLIINPLAGNRGGNVRLVLVVGRDNLNALAEKVAAEIFDGELCRDDRTLAADISVRLLPIRPELKLGVVTAIIGAPFLFALIYRLREEEA